MDAILLNHSAKKDLFLRITRIETKLARGFEEMGIDIAEKNDWVTIDLNKKSIHLKTIGRSLMVLQKVMAQNGVRKIGEEFTIYYKNQYFGSIVFMGI